MLSGLPLLLAIGAAVLLIILMVGRLRWHPFFSLLVVTLLLGLVIGLPGGRVVEVTKEGFGRLIGSVGLLIVLGSFIGVALERSGAARRIADLVLGDGSQPGLRLVGLGALVSVPVFCDSGFILLAGLLPALAHRSGRPLAVLALSLAGGLYLTHTLIPPTPGPLAAAANLGAEDYVGTIMLLGMVVSLPVLLVTWRLAERLGRHVVVAPPTATADELPENALPGPLAALAPLLLPVVLIACGSVLRLFVGPEAPGRWLLLPTDPTVALLLACIPALRLPGGTGKRSEWVATALRLAGPILVITGLGGAFGAVLKASSLATDVGGWFTDGAPTGGTLLLLGFAIAALLKTAQGSSTGALVIASSILYPLLPLAGFTEPTELALLTLSIGGGAMTFSHANDSYFWVVTQFSGIGVGDAYRSYSVLTAAMGLTTLVAVMLLYLLIG